MRTSRPPILLLFSAVLGCAPAVPTDYPQTSAASVDGAEAPPARVGRALEEEPPLPGETRAGWEALDRGGSQEGPSGHHGHHGHHGHPMGHGAPSGGGSADREAPPGEESPSEQADQDPQGHQGGHAGHGGGDHAH